MKYSHRLIFSCVFLPLRRESAASRLSRRFGEAKQNASETQSKSIVLRSACANGARLETAAEKVDEVKKVHLFCFFLVYELVSSSSSGPQRRRRRREGWRRRRRLS